MDKYYYNTVFSQAFSPCGNYLIAGNCYGEVGVYNVNYLGDDEKTNDNEKFRSTNEKPLHIHQLHSDGGVLSLVNKDNRLISGGVGEICGWEWKDILQKEAPLPKWTISLESNKETLQKPDVNVMLEEDNKLYVGGGDNNVHIYDLENGKVVSRYTGHEDFIHDIHIKDDSFASASEDGTVRMWDRRKGFEVHRIEPHKTDNLARPKLGKWIGAVALTDDWMICGGGPSLALWHLRSLSPSTVFSLNDNGVHVAMFNDDQIIAAGATPSLFHLGYNGQIFAQVPTSSTTIYTVVQQIQPFHVLSAAGSGRKLDICTNLNYRDTTFVFCR